MPCAVSFCASGWYSIERSSAWPQSNQEATTLWPSVPLRWLQACVRVGVCVCDAQKLRKESTNSQARQGACHAQLPQPRPSAAQRRAPRLYGCHKRLHVDSNQRKRAALPHQPNLYLEPKWLRCQVRIRAGCVCVCACVCVCGHVCVCALGADAWMKACTLKKKLFTLLDLCVSSLRRGHANLLCIVPILTDDPRRESESTPRPVRSGIVPQRAARGEAPSSRASSVVAPLWGPAPSPLKISPKCAAPNWSVKNRASRRGRAES